MKTPTQIFNECKDKGLSFIDVIEMAQMDSYNQAVKDCFKSATAYITQESVNGGKVAKVNSESILKNLKK